MVQTQETLLIIIISVFKISFERAYQLDFFLPLDFLPDDLLDDDFFFGTLAPDFRASDKPIAIACFLLFTFLPLRPLFNVPAFFSCIARFTLL